MLRRSSFLIGVVAIGALAALCSLLLELPSGQVAAAGTEGVRQWQQLWKSADIGQIQSFLVKDVDGDGTNEILAGTVTDYSSYTYHGHVNLFDGTTYHLKWLSPDIGSVVRVAVADLGGDGTTEIIAAVAHHGTGVYGEKFGYVYVFDAVTYEPKWQSENIGSPYELVITDLDSDGIKEIITSGMHYYACTRHGHVYVFDGQTYALKWRSPDVQKPRRIVVDDVDDDDVKEIVFSNYVTDCTSPWPGHIYVYDGTSFQLEWQSDSIGDPVSLAVTDVDSDGVKEIIAAARWTGTGSPQYSGYIYIFDGKTHEQEWKSANVNHGDLVVEDVDDDGIREIIYRGYIESPEAGYLYVFDGSTHSLEWKSGDMGRAGSSIVQDLDNDGTKEILTWVTDDSGARLLVVNGVTHTEEWRSGYTEPGPLTVADLDSDTWVEILVGGRLEAYHGRLYVFAFAPYVNQPPIAELTYVPSSPEEGNSVQFLDSSADPDGGIVSWWWDFGDGTTSELQNPSHTYVDNGNYVVTLTVTDDAGAVGSASATVDVSNVAPSVDSGLEPPFLLGWGYRKKVTIAGQAGAGPYYQVLLKIGESAGAFEADFHLENHGKDFPNDVRFTDDDGTTQLAYWLEKIEGAAPNRTAYFWVRVDDSLDSDVDIYCYYGKTGEISASNGDATFVFFEDAEDLSVGVLGNQGAWESGGPEPYWVEVADDYAAQGTKSIRITEDDNYARHTFPAMTKGLVRYHARNKTTNQGRVHFGLAEGWNGKAHIRFDNDGYIKAASKVGDTYVAVPLQPYSAGIWYQIEGAFDLDSDRWDRLWVDGVEKATNVPFTPGNQVDTVGLSIGGSGTKVGWWDLIILRKYVSPEPSFSSAGMAVASPGGVSLFEGETLTSIGFFTDPGADTWSATVDYGDGSGQQFLPLNPDKTFNLSHVYLDDGIYTVVVTIIDDDGGIGVATVTVRVNNVPPVVGAITAPVDPIPIGTEIAASVGFTDVGILDTHISQWCWDWAEELSACSHEWEPTGTVQEENGSGTATGVHTYDIPGVYVLKAKVIDDDTGEGLSEVYRYVVVYDRAGGFATGGGWIIPGGGTSEENDHLPNIDGTSKATFGFVVKYRNGASTTPDGQLEFQYRVGSFNLHSADYEWLVVTNDNWGKFHGLATINGSEDLYPFKVDSFDGDKDGGSQPDRFIIKIWAPGADSSNDEPIYKASGDLSGGQIKIHGT